MFPMGENSPQLEDGSQFSNVLLVLCQRYRLAPSTLPQDEMSGDDPLLIKLICHS
jgi:hypothetical protein